MCQIWVGNVGHGGSIAQWLAHLLPDPAALGLVPSIPEIFSEEKIVNVRQMNCSDESGQCLENVYSTHLVLASGKLVLQKTTTLYWYAKTAS